MKDYSLVSEYVKESIGNFENISKSRKKQLIEIAENIKALTQHDEEINLLFICTHNSRRSQFAQVWAIIASFHYNKTNVKSYSGGTEITDFNENAIKALKRSGFNIPDRKGINPKYKLHFSESETPITCFSKHFLDPVNPKSKVIALLVCSDADQHCPFIPEAIARFNFSFEDPRNADGTKNETEVYDSTCRDVATQVFYLYSKLK